MSKSKKINKYMQRLKSKKKFFKKNKGSKKNIIDGLNLLLKSYNKVIVLEDDIITSKYF